MKELKERQSTRTRNHRTIGRPFFDLPVYYSSPSIVGFRMKREIERTEKGIEKEREREVSGVDNVRPGSYSTTWAIVRPTAFTLFFKSPFFFSACPLPCGLFLSLFQEISPDAHCPFLCLTLSHVFMFEWYTNVLNYTFPQDHPSGQNFCCTLYPLFYPASFRYSRWFFSYATTLSLDNKLFWIILE